MDADSGLPPLNIADESAPFGAERFPPGVPVSRGTGEGRRVGDERVAKIAAGYWCGGLDSEAQALALDLMDATAEVQRLRGVVAEAVQLAREAIDAMEALCSGHDDCPLNHEAMEDRAARLAALSLPTPAPEGTDDQAPR